MIPDWKLERYLTCDLPAEEMREIRKLEETDEIFANRVRLFREDSKCILRKMPFENLSARLDTLPSQRDTISGRSNMLSLNFAKFAAALVLAMGVAAAMYMGFADGEKGIHESNAQGMEVALVSGNGAEDANVVDESGTRIKGMDTRMEVWKKTAAGIVQMENLGEASEGDEIQLRFSVPQKCFGLLFSMDGNGTITMHMGDGETSIALEPGKMTTLPFAYKLDNAPKFEKFFLLTSQNQFSVSASDIDAALKQDGVQVTSLTLRKVEGGK